MAAQEPNRKSTTGRVLRPLLWWLLLVLILAAIHWNQRMLKETRLYFSISLDGQPLWYPVTVTWEGHPIDSGARIPLGTHRFAIQGPTTTSYSTNLFVWYGRHDLGEIRLKRSMGTLSIKADPPALSITILEAAFNYPHESKFLRCRNHAILATFIYAGLRKDELLRLKLGDVDVGNLSIFVSQGKGSKDRIVPMSYALAQSLSRYLDERKRLKKTCPEFFTSFRRNVGFSVQGVRWLVDVMRAATGIEFSPHRLRHTFATLMIEGGCDIYSLSRMMGHSKIETTTIYLSASAEHLRSQITKHPLNAF